MVFDWLFNRQTYTMDGRKRNQITDLTNTRTCSYDGTDRLLGMTATRGPSESYTYDDVGNRTASHLSATYGYQSGKFNQLGVNCDRQLHL